MKGGVIAVSIGAAVMVVGIIYGFLRSDSATSKEPITAPIISKDQTEYIAVDDLAKKPGAYSGDVILRAVVSGVNEKEKVFAVIDSGEFEACGVTSCADYTIPVSFDGEMPAVRSLVLIKGRINDRNNGLVFAADSLQVIQ